MMLRSKRVLAKSHAVSVKRKSSRSKAALRRSLSEVYIEGRSTENYINSVFKHCGPGFYEALTTSDCASGVELSLSAAVNSSISLAKNKLSTEVEKCNSAVLSSSTSSAQKFFTSNQTADVHPSPFSGDSVRSFEMEDSVVEVIPTEISDVSILETKRNQPLSNDNRSTDADTSDIIIIPDSPGQGCILNKALKNTSHEFSQLPQSRKRKNTDESVVEILCDISGSRPKKQQKMECGIKERKLRTNATIRENFIVTASDLDRKVTKLTKNEKSADVINISGERSTGDGDDIIFISAEDDDVSVITTKEHKPSQEDVIILDSPPAQTAVQNSDKKTKKMVSVSTSITGLIPHYTKHLIDYISLDGKPPATTSGSSTGTPVLPADSRNREVMHNHIPVLNRPWSPRSVRQQRRRRGGSRKRLLNTRNVDPTVQSNCVPMFTFPPPSHASTGNQISPIRNPTQNSTNQNMTTQNSTNQNSTNQNSTTQNSTIQNSTTQNTAPENSVQSVPEVSQSPACTYGANIYNPNASEKEEYGLRPVIIDGNNIAMGHGKGKCFSWRGLHICIKYFLKRGHEVTAFVPTFRKGVCPPELRSEMELYERSGQVVFTPSRRVEGRLIVPYDDRFIVQCAAELGGVIVSTDNFRDLLSENSTWKETIQKRLLMFTWVGDLLMFPHDPLGKHGPKFEEFLRFPKKL